MSIGNIPEVLRQQILVGIILVGRLGVRKGSSGACLRQPGWPERASVGHRKDGHLKLVQGGRNSHSTGHRASEFGICLRF